MKYDGYSWIKVPLYKMDPQKSWEKRYRELEAHHVAETNFLIDEIRKLAAESPKMPDKISSIHLEGMLLLCRNQPYEEIRLMRWQLFQILNELRDWRFIQTQREIHD